MAATTGSGGKAVRRHRGTGTIELHIPSQLGWERAAMDLAAGVARRMGFPADRVDDIKTAISEATINAIEHGNGQDAGQRVQIVLVPGADKLEICIKDQSPRPFGPLDTAAPNLDDRLNGLTAARGWGIFLIRSLVDEAQFSSTKSGNVVRIVMHLGPQA
jgi:serine/threonine-protein kinase RsbW